MIFIGFGMLGLYKSLPEDYLDYPYIASALLMLAFLIYIINRLNKNRNRLMKT